MKTKILICLAGLFVQMLHAQILVRQQSSNQIKKAVYSGDASKFPQIYNGGTYYAIIPIPEINLTNMPSVTVWIYPTVAGEQGQTVLGLLLADYDSLQNRTVILTNGI